jgi:acylphosphatase
MALMIDKETKEAVPVTAFLKGDQLAKDIAKVNDAARGKFLTVVGMALCLMKNYDPFQSPTHFKMMDLLKKFDKNFNATGKNYGKVGPDRTIDDVMKRRQDRWNFLFIAGMWFQDLFNYDFRRTEMCIIPYATQQGEISFCAYNTGVGWRQIIENMHKNATVAEWYKNHGKHEIYAKGKNVNLQSFEHSLRIDSDDAARVRHLEHDIPLTAAEEDRARRKKAFEEQAKVRAIYEELVLKKPQPTVVQIGTLTDINKAVPANFANANKPVNIAPAAKQEAEPVAGD